jgi:hypothetical protein
MTNPLAQKAPYFFAYDERYENYNLYISCSFLTCISELGVGRDLLMGGEPLDLDWGLSEGGVHLQAYRTKTLYEVHNKDGVTALNTILNALAYMCEPPKPEYPSLNFITFP